MNIFTNDELNRLKFNLSNSAPNWVDKDNLEGLIIRLEAAEQACNASSKVCRGFARQSKENAPLEYAMFMALKEWRKVCGL